MADRRAGELCAIVGVLLLALDAAAQGTDFRRCVASVEASAGDRAAASCFQTVAEATGQWTEAKRLLTRAQQRHPSSGWIDFYLAAAHARQEPAAALSHYRSAVATFVSRSDAEGEAEARLGLVAALVASGRADDAWSEAPLALDAARRSGHTRLLARAMIQEALLAQQTGRQIERARRLLREAESLVFPQGPYELQVGVLRGLGNVSFEMGRFDEALPFYAALSDLARQHADTPTLVLARYSAITARRRQLEFLPDPRLLSELTDAARELVVLADASGHTGRRALAYRTLADLLASRPETRGAAEGHYRAALAQARQAGEASEISTCLWALGRFLLIYESSRRDFQAYIDEALQMATESGSATAVAFAWRQQSRLAWQTLPRDRALEQSRRALDAIEHVRRLQGTYAARASVFGAWMLDYHWLIGTILDGEPARADLAHALEVSERMRARALLDSLLRSPDDPAREDGREQRRQQILRDISDVQRRLLGPRLGERARMTLVSELERLEREEEAARAELIAAGTVQDVAPDFASMDSLEQSLHANEAILSFSIGLDRSFYGEFNGGASMLTITRGGTRVSRVADRARLHPIVSIFRGLTEHAVDVNVPSSVKLYDLLLRDALAQLPTSINRLIIIPDGALHHLPFAALRSAPDAPPLGSVYEITIVPSATVWRRVRAEDHPLQSPRTLVVADPDLPMSIRNARVAKERGWWPGVSELGRLPYPRTEARSVHSHMGADGRLLIGADAGEATVKSAIKEPFTLVHFATHAVIDETNPERSAVVLASDAASEDGLLQAREIADLRLTGRVVVLSACRTATGAVLAGEGVMALSRAFFEAGARTVVGTLWAIRDDSAAQFFDMFYASLRRGSSVGAALTDARQEAIRRGMPAATWSSIVVVGDDSVVPILEPPPAGLPYRRLGVIATTLLAVLAVAIFRTPRAFVLALLTSFRPKARSS